MITEKEVKEAMKKKLDHLEAELKAISTGRANADMLIKVRVEIHGAVQPIKALANISTPEPRTIAVTPFDSSTVRDVIKGIEAANLGFNPQCNDGKTIRINIPQMTEQRRKELAKQCTDTGEQAKIQIRAVRGDYRTKLKNDKTVPEDIVKKMEKSIDDATKAAEAEVAAICKKKEKEIVTV